VDPFLSGMAGNVLRQQGQTYLQRSQAFMQSKMGFLSGGTMQYLFNVTPEYGEPWAALASGPQPCCVFGCPGPHRTCAACHLQCAPSC
jgi:hypothetical protein